MDQNKRANFWNTFFMGRHSSSDHKRNEEGVTYINLSGEAGSERVLQTDKEVLVQRKDRQTGRWVTEYNISKIAPINYTVLSGYVHAVQQNVVVVAYWMGNGNFLTYVVVGRVKGKLVKLVGNEDIYYGDIFIKEGRLFEKEDSRYSEWIFKKGRLTLIPYTIPKIPGALRIEYELQPDGSVKVDQTRYTVPVGTIVQLIRSDLHPILEKGFISGSYKGQYVDMIEFLPELTGGIKITNRGLVEVQIGSQSHLEKSITIFIEAN